MLFLKIKWHSIDNASFIEASPNAVLPDASLSPHLKASINIFCLVDIVTEILKSKKSCYKT